MEIGKEEAPYILEPNELPAPLELPAAPEEPALEPVEPDKVPA